MPLTGTPPAVAAELLALLRCDRCGAALSVAAGSAALACPACPRTVPIVDGIPRFIVEPEDETARRTQASFGYEWTHFSDWRQSGEINFRDYFQDLDLGRLGDAVVLDAGCGMGRHARQIAPFARRVVAVDFSRAIEEAARNVAASGTVDCIQADLTALPLADGSFDLVYSLGVLHHLRDTEQALRGLVAKLRPGGRLRVYLYWKRHGWSRWPLGLVSAVRRVTTRLPFPLLRLLCWILSAGLSAFVVFPYRALFAVTGRRHESWPLAVYTKYPFAVLYNDQFDRFSAPIEKRYDPDEARRLLASVGLRDIEIRECFGWIVDGVKAG